MVSTPVRWLNPGAMPVWMMASRSLGKWTPCLALMASIVAMPPSIATPSTPTCGPRSAYLKRTNFMMLYNSGLCTVTQERSRIGCTDEDWTLYRARHFRGVLSCRVGSRHREEVARDRPSWSPRRFHRPDY